MAIAQAITDGINRVVTVKNSTEVLIAKDDLFWDRVVLVVAIAVLGTWGINWINTPWRGLWTVTNWLGQTVKETFGDLGHAPKVGDKISGYLVTSPFGRRKSPCAGCSTFHKGVDLGTPIGTQIYAPFNAQSETVIVQCRPQEQTGGGGLVAELIVTRTDSVMFYQALHLSKCFASKNSKSAIAATGNSGVGTGAHLDLRKAILPAGTTDFSQIDRGSLTFESISVYEAWWMIEGNPPKPDQPRK